MSTSETVTFDKGPCPCGAGYIAQHVTTQDNPWSSADVSYSIECSKCSREWRISHTALILRSSEGPYASASAAEKAAMQSLQIFTHTIVANHFSGFSASSKKAEHAELERLRLTAMSYRQYLEHVKNGGTIATAAAPLRNQRWLREAAEQQGAGENLNALLEAHLQATKAKEHASKQIVKNKIT